MVLDYQRNLKVQGLLGITVDDDKVFIVQVNELLGEQALESETSSNKNQALSQNSIQDKKSPSRKRRRSSGQSGNTKASSVCDSKKDYETIDLDDDGDVKIEPDVSIIDEPLFTAPKHRRTSEQTQQWPTNRNYRYSPCRSE